MVKIDDNLVRFFNSIAGCKNSKEVNDDGKLTFRQPTKRKEKEPSNKKRKSEMKQVKNSKLLSFGNDDEENEDT